MKLIGMRLLATAALVGGLVFVGATPAAAANRVTPAPTTSSNQMSPQDWAKLKADLNSNKAMTRTESVSGGTRTIVYTTDSGPSVVLREPSGSVRLSVSPNLSAGGCGWFQLCLYFNRNDQIMLYSGLGYLEIGLICVLVPGAGCVAGGVVVGLAVTYVQLNGLCPINRQLQIEIAPFPGWNLGCV